MADKFEYEVPFSLGGRLFDTFIMRPYITRFLLIRNKVMKSIAEKANHGRISPL
jgi:hypothetical protein